MATLHISVKLLHFPLSVTLLHSAPIIRSSSKNVGIEIYVISSKRRFGLVDIKEKSGWIKYNRVSFKARRLQ